MKAQKFNCTTNETPSQEAIMAEASPPGNDDIESPLHHPKPRKKKGKKVKA